MLFASSMSGHRMCKLTSPNLYFYGITKHAVTGLTEGIRRELRTMKSDVKVTVSILPLHSLRNSMGQGVIALSLRVRLQKANAYIQILFAVTTGKELLDIIKLNSI